MIPTLFGRHVPLIPSLFSRSPTEVFQKTFRRVWPHFQPKFSPRCGDRSRQEGQECRKDSHPHHVRCQGQGTRCCSQRRRDRHPRRGLFPSQSQHTGQRMCKSVRFRTGSVPSPIFSHYFSPPPSSSSLFFEKLAAISRSLVIVNAVTRAPLRVVGMPSSGLVLSPQTPNFGYTY